MADLITKAAAFGRTRTLGRPTDLRRFQEILRRQIATWTALARATDKPRP